MVKGSIVPEDILSFCCDGLQVPRVPCPSPRAPRTLPVPRGHRSPPRNTRPREHQRGAGGDNPACWLLPKTLARLAANSAAEIFGARCWLAPQGLPAPEIALSLRAARVGALARRKPAPGGSFLGSLGSADVPVGWGALPRRVQLAAFAAVPAEPRFLCRSWDVLEQ